MLNERAQIVLRVTPLSKDDQTSVIEVLHRLEGVRLVEVDSQKQVVKVDGAATDVELLAALNSLGKTAHVITHTRGVAAPPPPSSPTYLKMQLFMRLLGRKVNCCT
ncbi:hypothetical protein AB1Y20_000154 [Prymnesium parvum]|uniref:HMA domain-containing protein n=1 Tax=Prymnesium parvum TaxID=97485 RepID=A0AB34K864_PRYPA